MIYAYIAAAVAFAALGAYAKIQHSGKLAAEAQVEAIGAKLETQNAAVKQLKTDGDRRVAEATKGVAKAKAGTQKARTEAERLRAFALKPTATGKAGACPAAEGVALVREGLK